MREWRGLKPAAEEAVVQLKSNARRQAREDKARKAQVCVYACLCEYENAVML